MPTVTLVSVPAGEPASGVPVDLLGDFGQWLKGIPGVRNWIEEVDATNVHVIGEVEPLPPGSAHLDVPLSKHDDDWRRAETAKVRLFDPAFDYDAACAVVDWCRGAATDDGVCVVTKDGISTARPGDYIVERGTKYEVVRPGPEEPWPYDADQNDPLNDHRVAVTGHNPDRSYSVAFDRESPARPDGREAAMLGSYVTYLRYQRAGRCKKPGPGPFDINDEFATNVFYKHGPDAWAYRRSHWTVGPLYWPVGGVAMDLMTLLDHAEGSAHAHGWACYHSNPKAAWEQWKNASPGVFAGRATVGEDLSS